MRGLRCYCFRGGVSRGEHLADELEAGAGPREEFADILGRASAVFSELSPEEEITRESAASRIGAAFGTSPSSG